MLFMFPAGRRCCWCSSPTRCSWASGWGSPTPRSAAPASGSAWRTTASCARRGHALALFNTLFYTVVASVVKFALGLWLALLLNEKLPFKTFFRTVILLPYIVPTALSALAFWWIYDAQFSVISWVLVEDRLDHDLHRFPRQPVERAAVDDRRQRLARRAVRRHHAAGRACRRSRRRCTRRRRSTAPPAGSAFATSRCRC